MKRLIQGLRGEILSLIAGVNHLFAPSMIALKESNWFCLRVFVSLQVALAYFVIVVSVAVEMLPDSPIYYAATCGSLGIFAAFLLRGAWVSHR